MESAVFQSTRPRGARHLEIVERVIPLVVSIHAPAWGATSAVMPSSDVVSCFNPRARVGRDRMRDRQHAGRACFNPRARVGRDHCKPCQTRGTHCFNPRARVGRDIVMNSRLRDVYGFNPRARVGRDFDSLTGDEKHDVVSIHAPAWGATRTGRSRIVFPIRFNPRARVGRDRGSNSTSCATSSFNPRARVGRDCSVAGSGPRHTAFQSTRPRGARRGCRQRPHRHR